MSSMLLFTLSFVASLSLLITLHEFGHCWTASKLGIQVTRFSIGFGKPIATYRSKNGIDYTLGWLLLGGYVKMLDTREYPYSLPLQAQKRAFDHQPRLNRTLVIAAGPLVNLLFAILAYSVMGLIGIDRIKPVIGAILPDSIAKQVHMSDSQTILAVDKKPTPHWQAVVRNMALRLGENGNLHLTTQDNRTKTLFTYTLPLQNWEIDPNQPQLLQSLGIQPFYPPLPATIGAIKQKGPAAKAGLQVGDTILSIENTPINSWLALTEIITKHPNKTVTMLVNRSGQILTLPIKLSWKIGLGWKRIGSAGIESLPVQWPKTLQFKEQYNILQSIVYGITETTQLIYFNYKIIFKMLTGKISLKTLGGPITLFKIANIAWKQGLIAILNYLALISIMLGCLNLLPIPALDGGHLLLLAIESIRKKPLKPATELLITRLGIIVLVVLMVQATVNDLLR